MTSKKPPIFYTNPSRTNHYKLQCASISTYMTRILTHSGCFPQNALAFCSYRYRSYPNVQKAVPARSIKKRGLCRKTRKNTPNQTTVHPRKCCFNYSVNSISYNPLDKKKLAPKGRRGRISPEYHI